MLFVYHIPDMSRGSELKDFGIDTDSLWFVTTTNGNLESVKKAVKKLFIEKHKMFEFSQRAYEDALSRGVVFEDSNDGQGDHEYTFDSAKRAIENIEEEYKITEKRCKLEAKSWIGVYFWKEKVMRYFPKKSSVSPNDWQSLMNAIKERKIHEFPEVECTRPLISFVPKNLNKKDIKRILNDDLKPMDNYQYCYFDKYKECLESAGEI